MQFEREKTPETPNAPHGAARIKDERWRSAGPGFGPGRAGPRLSNYVVSIAALDVAPTKTRGGRDMLVGASSIKARVATVDEVTVGEAEIRADQDSVQVSPRHPGVPVLEDEQASVKRWEVATVEELCGRALTGYVRKSDTRCPDLPGDIVCRHWDERRVRRRRKKLGSVQVRIVMRKGAHRKRTQGGTGRCGGNDERIANKAVNLLLWWEI
jgi:hypothetical protein